MKLRNNDKCFACGKDNPIGLKLDFKLTSDEENKKEHYVAEFRTKPEHQGYVDIVHGGLIATALDEAMARLIWIKNLNAITAEINVRFKKLVRIGKKLIVSGQITKEKGKIIEAEAEATFQDGTVVAQARGKFIQL